MRIRHHHVTGESMMCCQLRRLLAAFVMLAGAAAAFAPGSARAETFHTCAGFIDSVPATITSQGVWCLRKDLSTNITSGNAITIATNNVTIDCNDFKVGGLAAGDASMAVGIYAEGRQNATVRNCSVRGFLGGIFINGGAGHLVEDNRLDNNLSAGILSLGDNILVQRNRVFDTGGFAEGSVFGIRVEGDVIDNTVAGVYTTAAYENAYGIDLGGHGSVARNNTVRGLVSSNKAFGIDASSGAFRGSTIDGNQVVVPAGTSGRGVTGYSDLTFCRNNLIDGFDTAMEYCVDAGGNITL